jgi:hypothetical protein
MPAQRAREIAMVALINRCGAVLSITLLGFAAVLLSAMPASAAALGLTASCSFVSTISLQCNIPVLSSEFNAEINYVSAQCNSTGVAFNIKQFQISAIPPNATSDIAYQVAGNRASVAGIANTAAIVDIHVKTDTTSEALIDLAPTPTGTTSCTVSVSATY